MRKSYFFLCLAISLGISLGVSAQTDPGITNLAHQWTFDDGTAKDIVGGADGTLMGNAKVTGAALSTLDGGYLSLPASAIAINTYPSVTAEVWFTSKSGGNTGFTMLSYFGNTTGSFGTDYFSMAAARGDNFSRTAISCGNTTSPWAVEDGVNSTEYDDGKQHQMVAVLTPTTLTFYIDGVNVGSKTTFSNTANSISALSTQFAYLAKGGYTGDPTWFGLIHKFSLYNTALTDANVQYLYSKGAESKSVISTSASSFSMDTRYNADQFSVSSTNLSSNITVTAPTGVLVSPTTITANQNDVPVTVVYYGTNVINDSIVLTSGTTVAKIAIKTADDSQCYVPMYGDGDGNLVLDPGANSLSNFAGWGTKNVVSLTNRPDSVYCGAASIEVGNGTSTCSGSLDVSLAGKLIASTTYRIRAKVKTIGGSFQIGITRFDDAITAEENHVIDTKGAWQTLEFTITSGATFGSTLMWFNNCGACTGKLGYIDNWEMFVVSEENISVSKKQFSFDKDCDKTESFAVVGSNLSSQIAITAPAGITLDKSTLPETAAGDVITLTWDGTTAVNGVIKVASGAAVVNIPVKALTTSSSACFTPLYTDKTNLVATPYMNSLDLFGGWGTKVIVQNPDSAYCGARCAAIDGSGSIDVVMNGLTHTSSKYKVRAMIKTLGGRFQLGFYNNGSSDITDTVNTGGLWKEHIFEFQTPATLGANQGVYFNNYAQTGKYGYIDNWEIYRVDTVTTDLKVVKDMIKNLYIANNHVVAEFEATTSNTAELSVYNVQGAIITSEKFATTPGRNRRVMTTALPTGMYIVRMTVDGQTGYRKLVK